MELAERALSPKNSRISSENSFLSNTHYLRHSIFWRNLDAHMDMVHTRICFNYLYSFVFTQFFQNFSYRPAIPSVYQLTSELRSENDVILAVPTGMV